VETTVENTVDPSAVPSEPPFETRRDLPSGGWVQLRHPDTLRKKDRDRILNQVSAQNYGAAGVELNNATIATMIEDWHLPYLADAPVPHRNPKILGELTIKDGVALEKIQEEYRAILFPDKPSVDQAGIPGSPTPPASD
jgi:hypothetical protein